MLDIADDSDMANFRELKSGESAILISVGKYLNKGRVSFRRSLVEHSLHATTFVTMMMNKFPLCRSFRSHINYKTSIAINYIRRTQ